MKRCECCEKRPTDGPSDLCAECRTNSRYLAAPILGKVYDLASELSRKGTAAKKRIESLNAST